MKRQISRSLAVKRFLLFLAIYTLLSTPFIIISLFIDIFTLGDDLFPVFYIIALAIFSVTSVFAGIWLADYRLHSSKALGINEISMWGLYAGFIFMFSPFLISFNRDVIPLWAKVLIIVSLFCLSGLFCFFFVLSLRKKENTNKSE